VADPSGFLRSMISDTLRRYGQQVHDYGTATELLTGVANQRLDLILLDMNLPDLDGVEVTRRIKSMPDKALIPVVLMGSNELDGLLDSREQAGANAALAKPFTPPDLLRWFREVSAAFYGHVVDIESFQQVDLNAPAAPPPLTDEQIRPYLEQLKDEDKGVRMEACYQIGEFADRAKQAVEPLIELLFDLEDDVRAEAAFALGEIRDPSCIPSLMPLLTYKNQLVRERVAEALGAIGDRSAVHPLLKTLRSQDRDMIILGIKALVRIGDPQAIPSIEQMVGHKDQEVAANATWAIREFQDAH
jgi:two-component system chemotaxis response regulator CheY